MTDDFGTVLAGLIDAAGMTRSDFAVRSGMSASFVSNMIYGDRTPSDEALRTMADALRLEGNQRSEFIAAGIAAKARGLKAAAPYVRGKEREIDDLEAELALLQRRIDAFEALSVVVVPYLQGLRRSGQLPPEVGKAIEAYLYAIQRDANQ